MNYVPPVLALPIVGPTLVPAIFADNTLCGRQTERRERTTSPAPCARTSSPPRSSSHRRFPRSFPLPPIIGPREVSVNANRGNVTLTGLLDNRAAGSADGSSLELVLNGGTDFTTTWSLTAPPDATCIDINSRP